MLLFIYINAIWFFAGLIVGVTSFGGNLFGVPLLTFVMPARDAVVLGCLLVPALCVAMVLVYRKDILWREMALLGLSSGAGIPLGLFFLRWSSSRTILFAAAFCVFVFLFWQWFASRRTVASTPLGMAWAIPLGILSGIMAGGTSLGGPPLAFYALRRQWDKRSTLGTLAMTGMLTTAFLLPMQWQAGLYTPELLKLGVWGSVFAILGILASLPLVSRINVRLFRILMLIMIGFSALSLLVKGILAA